MQVRTEFLSLMELILKNSDYASHLHKRHELELCFRRILQEDDEDEGTADVDKTIARQIVTDYPDWFEL